MASASKSVNLKSNNGYIYPLTASFVENSTSTTNNTSNITCTATLSAPNAYWTSSYNSTLAIYWHDNRQNKDVYVASENFKTISLGGSISVSDDINVTHNTDGTLSGYAYATFTKGGTSAFTPNSGDVKTDWTSLTQIDRYAVTNSVAGSDIEGNFSVSYTKYVNTYKYKLRISLPHIIALETIDYNTSDQVITLQQETINSLLSRYTNTASFDLGFAIETWDSTGSTQLSGGNEVIITAKIINANPTFNAAYQDTNATTLAITNDNQLIIQNNSTLQVNITNASAKKQASVSSVKITIAGQTTTQPISGATLNINLGTINLSSNTDMVVTLVDSRGLTSSQTLNLQMLEWSLPTAIITLARQNNFYTETDINVNADYSSLNNENTITIQYRYKKVSDTNYSQYYILQDNVQATFNADNTYEWNVQVLVQDKLGSTTYNLTLNKGIPIAFFDRLLRSFGVNCFPSDEGSLEVSGENILTRIAGYGQGANQVTGDWNSACGTASGFYMGENLSHSPSGTTVSGWWWVIHLVHNENYQRQIAFSFLNNSEIYTRIMNNGTWNNWTQVGEAQLYSTNESVVGKWVDNKPVYKKTITTSGSTGTNTLIAHNISNLKRIVKCEAIATDDYGTSYPKDNATFDLKINKIDNTNIDANIAGAFSTWNIHFILEYTKTTD